MSAGRAVGATLFLCLAASQAAVLVLTPVLASVAADLDISTATAGQLRTISGLAAGATAVCAGLLSSRVGLRELTGAGLVVLAAGSALSALAGEFAVLAVPQLLVTGIRTAAIQIGYFIGAAVGGVALAGGGYAALGLAFAALFVGAAIPHLMSTTSESPSPLLP